MKSDTTETARAELTRIRSSLSGEQRLRIALEMSVFARELSRARIRKEHPEWSERQIARELMRLAFFPKPLPEGY